jgi:uncharacterized membrane protein YjgN (DUF898 family)
VLPDGPGSPAPSEPTDESSGPAPSEPTAAAPPVPEPQPLAFTGSGREYFRIWIVNILLSIITLGIYSAWAKVRRMEYFYRNTRLAGACFDYHGKPIAILKGRIVAAVLFAVYYISGYLNPFYGLGAAVVLGLALPYLISRALRFRFYNSSYRGLRFEFLGSTKSAYWTFLALPVLSVFTLFLLLPFVQQRIKRYTHAQAAYGQTRFTFSAAVAEFYVTYVLGGLLLAGVIFAAFWLFFFLTLAVSAITGVRAMPQSPDHPEMTASAIVSIVVFIAAYGLGLLSVRAFVTARIQNLVWNSTTLGQHRFSCRIRAPKLFALLATNVAATIVTLGLFTPFAHVRLARYMAEVFTLVPRERLDNIVASERQRSVSAFGEEAAEVFDLDVAL